MLKCVCRLQQQKQNPQSSDARDGIEKGPNETMSERTRESPRRCGETRKLLGPAPLRRNKLVGISCDTVLKRKRGCLAWHLPTPPLAPPEGSNHLQTPVAIGAWPTVTHQHPFHSLSLRLPRFLSLSISLTRVTCGVAPPPPCAAQSHLM